MSDIDYAALFEISEDRPEFADPAEDSEALGEKEQEPADPDDIGAWMDLAPWDEEEAPQTDTPMGQQEAESEQTLPQSAEDNAKYAAARRKAEAELTQLRETAAVDKQAAVDAAYARMNLKNSYTGESINSEADYLTWQSQFEAEQSEAELQNAGITPELMNNIISAHPAVRQAAQAAARLEQGEQRAKAERARQKLASELTEISRIDPGIQRIEDIKAMPTYGRFVAAVDNGASFLEAYKIANADAVIERRAAALMQSRLNNTAGKGHLTGSEAHGKGMSPVPPEVVATYRNINPEMSIADIQKHYNKYLSGV